MRKILKKKLIAELICLSKIILYDFYFVFQGIGVEFYKNFFIPKC